MTMRIAVLLSPVLLLLLVSGAEAQPVHGNWCGAKHGEDGRQPTSTLDEACMQHDKCYDAKGPGYCKCDEALRIRAESIATSTRSEGERAAALAVASYYRVAPCTLVSKDKNVALRTLGGIVSPITGTILPVMEDAEELGHGIDDEIIQPAKKAVEEVVIQPAKKVGREVRRFFSKYPRPGRRR